MALRSYAGWLAEKARDKAVVAAAGWVDLYWSRGRRVLANLQRLLQPRFERRLIR